MIALKKIIVAACLINCSIFAMDLDDDNDLADVSFAMQQMHLDDEDPEFRDAYANEHGIASEHAYSIQDLDQMMQYAQKGCGTLPIKEALESHMKDSFEDYFKSYVLGNIHSKKLRRWHRINSVAFDPSGTLLATEGEDSEVRIFKLEDGNWQCKQKLRHDSLVCSVAFDPSGDWWATGSRYGGVRIFKLAAFKQAEDILLIPENEKQNDLLRACQIAMHEKKYVHATDEQLATFKKLPERMRNALKQFIVTKEQCDRIKKKNNSANSN